MPLTDAERNAIKLEVYNAMRTYGRGSRTKRSIYGSEGHHTLNVCDVFLSKPLTFQRHLLLLVTERQVFTYQSGDVSYSAQERCRGWGGFPFWGTEDYNGEDFLRELRNNTINQLPDFYRIVFCGVFKMEYAGLWAHWLNVRTGLKDPNQSYENTGLFNYTKTTRFTNPTSDYGWSVLYDFIVGTESGGNITYGLLPHLWCDAIDAMEPQATTGALLQIKSPPPVYIFSLDTLPDLDKNTFVMVDLLAETPPATFQNLLASKVKSRGKSVVFNALYSQSDRQKVERRRVLVNPTTETYRWDNSSYTWTREGEANTGREIIYETKNYLTLSEAMTILDNL